MREPFDWFSFLVGVDIGLVLLCVVAGLWLIRLKRRRR